MSNTNNQELLKLPLDAWHRAQGARMVEFAGYEMPMQYEGIMAEHLWTRENAGLFDVSHMGQLFLRGDGAAEALEAIVPGDISALKEGRMRYSLLLAEDGGVLDDLMVTNAPTGLYLVVNGAMKHQDIAFLREQLAPAIEIEYLDGRALLALQGPRAATALADLIPGVADLYFMEAASFLWGKEGEVEPLWISRSGYTGEDGFEISLSPKLAPLLADALLANEIVKPIGLGARDSLRLEAGLPLYGHDMDPTTNPVEASASFAISKSRRVGGGFHGSERILRALADGPVRKLVGLLVEGKMPVREGAVLFKGSQEVGRVTSGGFAPSIGAPIAMGYVSAGHFGAGTTLEAEVRGKRVPVIVTRMPFVPHRYHRRGNTQ